MSYYRSLIETVPVTNPYIADLIAYYKFDANANDFSGNGNNGTAINGGGLNYLSIGKVGTAINFGNNTNLNYIEFADDDDFSFTNGVNDLPFTISCWTQVLGYSTIGNWIFNKRGDTTNMEYQLVILPTGQIVFTKYSGGNASNSQRIASNTGVIISSTWQNIIITNAGTTNINDVKIYLNGTLITVTRTLTGTYTGMTNGNNVARMALGSYSLSTAAQNKHRGFLDEFYIWKNRELTATEALDVYNKGNTGIALI